MTELEIARIIKQAKVRDSLHLYHRHRLDKFTKSDVAQLINVLQRDHKSIDDLALEDLTLPDEELVSIACLVEYLPLTKFSWQGVSLGDKCVAALCRRLPAASVCQLKSLEVGGLMATDVCLQDLAQLIIATPSLREVSVNWSPHFSLAQAWKMAVQIAVHNISLRENNFHEFFHSVGSKDPVGIAFINAFLSMIVKRNNVIANTKNNDHYIIYKKFNDYYNHDVKRNFAEVKQLYALTGFSLEDLQYSSLTQDPFLLLLAALKLDKRGSASVLTTPRSHSSSSSSSSASGVEEEKSSSSMPVTQQPSSSSSASHVAAEEEKKNSPSLAHGPVAALSPIMTAIVQEDSAGDLVAQFDTVSIRATTP